MAQRGKEAVIVMRTFVAVACCVVAVGCMDSGAGNNGGGKGGSGGSGAAGTGGSGALDGGGRDAIVIDDADVCGREQAAQADLMTRARAAGCARDQDCTLIGSCDGGFGFVAVPVSFAAETQALMDATECDWFDGPSYGAVCETGECVARENGGACGSDEPPLCTGGQLFYENPCGNASPNDASLEHSGCHTPCDPSVQTNCPDGTTCLATSVCPAGLALQAEGCFQCDAITVSLCVP